MTYIDIGKQLLKDLTTEGLYNYMIEQNRIIINCIRFGRDVRLYKKRLKAVEYAIKCKRINKEI